MNCKIITSAENITSVWSGGTTSQVAIFPQNGVYANRDFLWRVSSAQVVCPQSDFTALPDYDRVLVVLEGAVTLNIDGETHALPQYGSCRFGGESITTSVGKIRDFNLMYRKGTGGYVDVLPLSHEKTWVSLDCDHHVFYACAPAEITIDGALYKLHTYDALLVTTANCPGQTAAITGIGMLLHAKILL